MTKKQNSISKHINDTLSCSKSINVSFITKLFRFCNKNNSVLNTLIDVFHLPKLAPTGYHFSPYCTDYFSVESKQEAKTYNLFIERSKHITDSKIGYEAYFQKSKSNFELNTQHERKPIHILQVGMSPYYGGTEAFIMNQYREIDRSKVQFDFLNVYNEKIACQEEIEALGGRIFYLNIKRRDGLISYYRNINEFYKRNANLFDAVHCHYQSLENTDMLKYAKKYGIKVRIVHAHSSGYSKKPSMIIRMLILKNQFNLKKYATHYFACSSLAAKWMFNRQATIINNAIDTHKYVFSNEKRKFIREQLGLRNEFTLMFVGRLIPIKNPIFLLEIFTEIHKKESDSKLIITGDGILHEEITDKINSLGLSDSVIMTGTRSDVNELLQAADAFLLPSKAEGLGIVLIEAQAAGLPSYTSDKVVPNDVQITDLLHFVSLNEPAEVWADVILQSRMIERRNTESQIKIAGYDNKENAKKLENLYVDAVANSL